MKNTRKIRSIGFKEASHFIFSFQGAVLVDGEYLLYLDRNDSPKPEENGFDFVLKGKVISFKEDRNFQVEVLECGSLWFVDGNGEGWRINPLNIQKYKI